METQVNTEEYGSGEDAKIDISASDIINALLFQMLPEYCFHIWSVAVLPRVRILCFQF